MDLSTTEFYIDVPALPKSAFRDYATQLFDRWEQYAERHLSITDYSVELFVEEGSIKGLGRIAATVGYVYAAICGYGSLVQGLEIIQGQIKGISTYLATNAGSEFKTEGHPIKTTSHGGALSQIRRLFLKVQRGQMSADQAEVELMQILGDEAADDPAFIERLKSELVTVPPLPKQLDFSDSYQDVEEFTIEDRKPSPKAPRQPRSPPPTPIHSQHFRIEVRRNTKSGERIVKLIDL